MSIASRPPGDAPLADASDPAAKTKTPPKRQMTVLADPRLIPEPR